MDAAKLDLKRYEKESAEVAKAQETNRLAIRDNFAQLLATDNYLEKYLPF